MINTFKNNAVIPHMSFLRACGLVQHHFTQLSATADIQIADASSLVDE